MSDAIQTNAEQIRGRVADAADRADRDAADVTIVAVSKGFSREAVDAAYDAGFRVFGENRVQEVREKYAVPSPSDMAVDFIGSLQTNKVAQVLPFITTLETIDRPSIISALQKRLEITGESLPVLLEVNVSGETQKAGVSIEAARELANTIRNADHLKLTGLMTMAPLGAGDAILRQVFGGLRDLRDHLQQEHGEALPTLSMGMSNDFEIAIEEGATHIRIGRALFGERG